MCNEDIPRQERAAENYMKQSVNLDSKVITTWKKWDETKKNLLIVCEQALSDCPELTDFVDKVHLHSELRQIKARDNLRQKLLSIQNDEIEAFTEYMSDMPNMLKKLYLTLKGYDKAPPALTTEYLEIMKKAKSAKGISWSDDGNEGDAHFKFISTLDLHKPSTTIEYRVSKKDDVNVTIDIITDSEDPTDKKRKGTPIKLLNNETIVINDSFESLDTTRNLNSAKKIKREYDIAPDVENYGPIDPNDLNSTFVLNAKMGADLKKSVKTEFKMEHDPVKRGLTDRTNTMLPRTINFGDKGMPFN